MRRARIVRWVAVQPSAAVMFGRTGLGFPESGVGEEAFAPGMDTHSPCSSEGE